MAALERTMNVLIVHAHPEARSFNAAMMQIAAETLRAAGHVVAVSDLYAQHFNPVAGPDDFGCRRDPDYLVYALEQRHNVEQGTLAPDIAAELDKLLSAELVIFNFPIYWYGMPAIMKGWIDRVFVSGLCYGGRRIYDRGGLRGKRAMLAVSLGGSPQLFGPDGIHGDIEVLLQPILQGMLAYTGMTVLPPFIAWHVPYIDADARAAILDEYRVRLKQLDTLTPLRFPSLADYDERLRPLRPAAAG